MDGTVGLCLLPAWLDLSLQSAHQVGVNCAETLHKAKPFKPRDLLFFVCFHSVRQGILLSSVTSFYPFSFFFPSFLPDKLWWVTFFSLSFSHSPFDQDSLTLSFRGSSASDCGSHSSRHFVFPNPIKASYSSADVLTSRLKYDEPSAKKKKQEDDAKHHPCSALTHTRALTLLFLFTNELGK